MKINKSKILFLLSEIHNYHLSLIEELVFSYEYDVLVIYRDKKKQTPYKPTYIRGVKFMGKSAFKTYGEFKNFILKVNPILVRTSGWIDKDYLKISKTLKKKGVVSVVVSDTQWKNSFRQTLGALVYGKYIISCFNKMMVAGPYQYEYARKIGFTKKNILFSNLSANTNIFDGDLINQNFEKKFVYVGNLEKIKGTHLLLEAWNLLQEKKSWKLELIGNGSYYKKSVSSDIIYRGFLSSDEIKISMRNSAFFILPSVHEQWGVVMHEATLSGIPILCSDEVGSIPLFMINGFNGFTFESNSVKDLCESLDKIINLSQNDLLRMRENSLSLSKRITTPISAASLLSAIK